MAEGDKTELLYKILVVGDVGVGKTSLVKRYAHGLWAPNYKATIGVDFSLKEIYDVAQNTTIRVQLWDVAGQERYKNLTRVYYNQAVGAVIVYDGTRDSTLEGALEWKADIDHKVFLPGGGSIPCILVRNKADLPQSVALSHNKQQQLTHEHQFHSVHEVSAKTGVNVDQAISTLVQHIYENNLDASGQDDEDEGPHKNTAAKRGILTESRDALPGVKKSSCSC
eukprot:TRINITY_DN14714_c0_g1_i1.p1 TRINITY_DN14714_c0_g1~~TRINITY_DN14714_c0_g1_i1.p1  ORF type:complete len:224 (+),score=72.18 TRINITY_DN14714_c0_g1_i1:358-1029(+)